MLLFKTQQNLDLSEPQEIIDAVPGWVITNGLALLCCFSVIMVSLLHFITYAETTHVKVVIIPRYESFTYTVPAGYRLIKQSQRTHILVQPGQPLAVARNQVPPYDEKVIVTPVTGRFILVTKIDNTPVLHVIPQSNAYDVNAAIPRQFVMAARANPRAVIQIEVPLYPAASYGYLEGRISSIAPVAIDNHYTARVQLTQGMITSKGYHVDVYHKTAGAGEMSLASRSILARLFPRL